MQLGLVCDYGAVPAGRVVKTQAGYRASHCVSQFFSVDCKATMLHQNSLDTPLSNVGYPSGVSFKNWDPLSQVRSFDIFVAFC